MIRIAIDEETLIKLQHLNRRLELCNEQGETLGFFVPRQEHEKECRKIYQWAKAEIAKAEVDQSLQDSNDHSLTEILEELESQWPSR